MKKSVSITLKGQALICAVESGLVPETVDEKGYNITAFSRFWDMFSPLLDETADNSSFVNMISENSIITPPFRKV